MHLPSLFPFGQITTTMQLKTAIKKLASRTLPDRLFTRINSVRSRNYQYRFLKNKGLLAINDRMIGEYGVKVLRGPFQGMTYPPESLRSRHGTPKLLGSYERELHFVISKAIADAHQYDYFIDIGCAEGYYAVGLALKSGKNVYAFDTEPRELAFCREMARQNDVDTQVFTNDWCDSRFLRSLQNRRCFIISDCEGYEGTLFEGETVHALAASDLLIELHDWDGVTMSNLICDRFNHSHDIRLISAESRNPDEYAELGFLATHGGAAAISEYRNIDQKWAYLTSKKAAA